MYASVTKVFRYLLDVRKAKQTSALLRLKIDDLIRQGQTPQAWTLLVQRRTKKLCGGTGRRLLEELSCAIHRERIWRNGLRDLGEVQKRYASAVRDLQTLVDLDRSWRAKCEAILLHSDKVNVRASALPRCRARTDISNDMSAVRRAVLSLRTSGGLSIPEMNSSIAQREGLVQRANRQLDEVESGIARIEELKRSVQTMDTLAVALDPARRNMFESLQKTLQVAMAEQKSGDFVGMLRRIPVLNRLETNVREDWNRALRYANEELTLWRLTFQQISEQNALKDMASLLPATISSSQDVHAWKEFLRGLNAEVTRKFSDSLDCNFSDLSDLTRSNANRLTGFTHPKLQQIVALGR